MQIWLGLGLVTAVHLVIDVVVVCQLQSTSSVNPYQYVSLICGSVIGFATFAVLAVVLISNAIWKLEDARRWFPEREDFRLALDAGEMGAWNYVCSTGLLRWDSRQFALFGIRQEDFLGCFSQAINVIHPEDRPRIEAACQRTEQLGVSFQEEFRVIHPDGTVHWLAGFGRALRNSAEKIDQMVGVNFDITNRKEMEEALKQSSDQLESQVAQRTMELHDQTERLRAILNNTVSSIITIDKWGVIRSVNRATENLFGYTMAELIGQNVSILMPSPFRENHDGYIQRFITSGQGRIIGNSRELIARRKDNTLIDIELAVNQIDKQELFTGIVQDISRRKELEREVVEISALEQQRIGQDLHDDVGQQLTALGLLAAFLVETIDGQENNTLEMARKLQNGLRRVLHQIRSISRGLALAEISPAGLTTALTELVSRISETSGVQCTLDSHSIPPNLETKQTTHLYHIAQEACTNAIKHSQAKQIDVRLHGIEGGICLQIEDNGIGISPDTRLGLGWKIMQNRAGALGARLTSERATPHGTVITCLLHQDS